MSGLDDIKDALKDFGVTENIEEFAKYINRCDNPAVFKTLITRVEQSWDKVKEGEKREFVEFISKKVEEALKDSTKKGAPQNLQKWREFKINITKTINSREKLEAAKKAAEAAAAAAEAEAAKRAEADAAKARREAAKRAEADAAEATRAAEEAARKERREAEADAAAEKARIAAADARKALEKEEKENLLREMVTATGLTKDLTKKIEKTGLETLVDLLLLRAYVLKPDPKQIKTDKIIGKLSEAINDKLEGGQKIVGIDGKNMIPKILYKADKLKDGKWKSFIKWFKKNIFDRTNQTKKEITTKEQAKKLFDILKDKSKAPGNYTTMIERNVVKSWKGAEM